ncbi:MAG TPA: glycosyltransferase, partial [Acidimicrobiia bacterium]|nr:glycosyltransferase [Acidimicrobiia bacterium]
NVPDPFVPPTVSVMAPTNRADRIPNIIANCARQTWQPDEIVLVLHGIDVDEGRVKDEAAAVGIDSVNVLRQPAEVILGEVFNAGFLAASGDYIAKMDDDDYYGAEYLADLIDAFTYTEADVVGKWAHYAYLEGIDATIFRYGDFEHTYHDVLAISTLLIKRQIFEHHRFPAMPVGSGSVFLRNVRADGARIYSADRFNYLYNRYSAGGHHTFPVSDLQLASNSVLVCQGKNLDHVDA